MSETIKGYGAVFLHPEKGHDKISVSDENRIYAVMDGTGDSTYSQLAYLLLQSRPPKSELLELRRESPADFLIKLVHAIDNNEIRNIKADYRAAASLACIDPIDEGYQLTHITAGDTSLYKIDEDGLTLLGHQPAKRWQGPDGKKHIDPAGFLGSGRSIEAISRLVQTEILPSEKEWSIIAMTDGVPVDSRNGITEEFLRDVTYSEPANEVPNVILKKIKSFEDDAAVVHVHHSV